ncbi:MAG: hypothetical protein LCH56_03515 [Proteobacteria bacterium]|nr:hypothetical protein [Pseudomonadota bacterium]
MSKAISKMRKPTAGNVVAMDDARARIAAELKAICGVDDEQIATWLPRQLLAAMGPDIDVSLVRGLIHELQPRNALECMIATQMIALHSCGMYQLALATHPDNDTDGINITLNRAIRLLRTANELTQTWQSLKGKRASKQSVVVKHVTVQSGGQAIVGAVAGKTGGES